MQQEKLTIGRFAQLAGVGIETVRFYQRRGLLETPKTKDNSFRVYSPEQLQQLRFIKRAQVAGFTLEEIKRLFSLHVIEDKLKIQGMARQRLEKLNVQIIELQQVADMLKRLVCACEQSAQNTPCPIVETFASE